MSQGTKNTVKVKRKTGVIKQYNTKVFDKRLGYVESLPDRIRAAMAVHSRD